MLFINLILSVCFSSQTLFLSKQSLDTLRYISKDGKFSYYQTRFGSLNMTTNFDNNELLKLTKGTQFLIHSEGERNQIILEVSNNYHQAGKFIQSHDLYIAQVGESNFLKVAVGRKPVLSLKQSYLSFYHPESKKVVFLNILKKTPPVEVKLANTLNPYFLSETAMINEKTLLYTDINTSGYEGLMQYDVVTGQFFSVFKANKPGSKIEFCLLKNQILVGNFGRVENNDQSQIYSIPLFENQDYKKRNLIYTSNKNDLGNMLCTSDSIFFIKTITENKEMNYKKTEVAKIDLETKKLSILTDLDFVIQVINMGGRIMVPFKENYYLLEGRNDALKKGTLETTNN